MPVPRPPVCLVLLLLLIPLLSTRVKGDAASDLAQLQDEFFQWEQKIWPFLGTNMGNMAYNGRLEDLSLEVFDTRLVQAQRFLISLTAIDRGQLSRHHQYSYDVLQDMLLTFMNNYAWRNYGALNPINFLGGFYLNLDSVVSVVPLDTREHFDDFTSRLEAWPAQIDQMMVRMNKSIELGTTNHIMSVRTVPDQIAAVIETSPEDSPLYRPFNTTLDTLNITQQDRDLMRSRALAAVGQMWTALDRLKTYMNETYMANTRATYGVHGLPEGRDYYRACLKWHLSMDMTPDEVFLKGLEEVDRISQLMRQVMERQGFNGTIREYYSQLNRDPRFQMNTAEEILQAYRDLIHERAYPKLPPLFKDIPPNPVVVKPLPYDGPGGMYSGGSEDGTRPGTFWVNVFRPNDTKTFSMPSLTLHEVVPGHHLQAVYVLASKIPDFQKYFWGSYFTIPFEFPFYTAYMEGWGLYSEYLGEEMGVYHDDYEMMGRYGDELFRACRLVVDTGLHYYGWDRSTAIRYFADRLPFSLATIEIEIDRYLTRPGQACAYKIGELKIKELRKKATSALGSKFDIRDFHSAILTNGQFPLSVLETIVDDYIADNTKPETPTGAATGGHCMSSSNTGLYLLLTSLMVTLLLQ